MPPQCLRHLNRETVIRVDEIGTHQQQDNVRRRERSINLVGKLLARENLAIMPSIDDALPSQGGQGAPPAVASVLRLHESRK